MRRQDRAVDREFAMSVIDKCAYAVISMSVENAAYAVPVSIVRDGDELFFHCAREGKKTDAMLRNPAVQVTCVGDVEPETNKFSTAFESAFVFGKATEVTDNDAKIRALKLICEKYTPDNMPAFDSAIKKSLNITAVWRISIDNVTAKRKA